MAPDRFRTAEKIVMFGLSVHDTLGATGKPIAPKFCTFDERHDVVELLAQNTAENRFHQCELKELTRYGLQRTHRITCSSLRMQCKRNRVKNRSRHLRLAKLPESCAAEYKRTGTGTGTGTGWLPGTHLASRLLEISRARVFLPLHYRHRQT